MSFTDTDPNQNIAEYIGNDIHIPLTNNYLKQLHTITIFCTKFADFLFS